MHALDHVASVAGGEFVLSDRSHPTRVVVLALLTFSLITGFSTAFAATGAHDTAAHADYNSGWGEASATTTAGTWGGKWTFTTTGSNSGRFVGTSANNGFVDGNMGFVFWPRLGAQTQIQHRYAD